MKKVTSFQRREREAMTRHQIKIVPSPNFDAGGLVYALCRCGHYRSGIGTERFARKAWKQHARDALRNEIATEEREWVRTHVNDDSLSNQEFADKLTDYLYKSSVRFLDECEKFDG